MSEPRYAPTTLKRLQRIVGPDNFEIGGNTDVSDPSVGPGSVLSVIHEFTARVGDTPVESCWQSACVYEWVSVGSDPDGDGTFDVLS